MIDELVDDQDLTEDFEDDASDRLFERTPDDDGVEEPVRGAFAPMIFNVSQRRIQDLHNDYVNKDLDPRPPFQRGFVWDRVKASRLVESVLLNVPIPLLYTAEEIDGREVVIDGQQRLLSLFGFISNKFPGDDKPFRLTKLSILQELNLHTFDQLQDGHKRAIKRYDLQVIKISSNSPYDVRFEIFERLNSGSVKLNAQELRNCVFRGDFNTLLRELSDSSTFQKCLGVRKPLPRMQDCELVLRFLTFYDRTYLNYAGGLKSFLNDMMESQKPIKPGRADDFRKAFRHAVELSYTVFGEHAFRKYTIGTARRHSGNWEKQINRPLYDIVMWGFTRYEKYQIVPKADAIRDALIELMIDAEFRDAITSATADKARTNMRFERWKNMLDGIVSEATQGQRLFDAAIKKDLYSISQDCKLCNQRIMTLDDSEVDHIIPFSKGGQTSPDNAQLAHRYCNRAKGSEG